MRYKGPTKAKIVLAWYHHKRGKPLGALMLRYMTMRLWVELTFQMPPGRSDVTKQKNQQANLLAGRYTLNQAEISKETTVDKIVGYKKPWYVSHVASENVPKAIIEKTTKKVSINNARRAAISRSIGIELKKAVEHAIGNRWLSDSELLARATKALEPTLVNPKKR